MKQNLVLFALILAKFFLSYAMVDPVYELHRDEYLHLDQADHLAWGYLSVPPLTSWFSVVIQVLGGGEFWVKFFPCLFGALTMAVVWKTVETIGGNWFALILAAVSVLLSSLLRLNLLFQPNSFEILAWTFTCFCFIRYFMNENPRWLYLASVAFALGILNKYNIAFFALGLAPALLFSEHRKLVLQKHFWFASALAFILILPNLIWQMNNHFPVIHHMELLKKTQLVNVSASDFLKEQLRFFFGSIHILIAAFVALAFYRPFRKYRLFLWSAVFTLMLFTLFHAKGYYAIALYPIFLAFGSVALENRLTSKPGIILRGICLSVPIGFFFVIYPIVFPVNSPKVMKQTVKQYPDLHLARWEDGKDHDLPQDFADMLGWKELTHKVQIGLNSLPKNEYTIILCDNYGQAGAINYYLKDKSVKAVTMNADYVNWIDLGKPVVNIILVQEASDDDPGRKRERGFFETVQRIGSIENNYAREKGTTVYVLKRAKVNINRILKADIDAEKSYWE